MIHGSKAQALQNLHSRFKLATVRYVERNPVVAGLCLSPADWKWSSASAHLTGQDDGLVRVHPMLERINNWAAYLSGVHEDDFEAIERHTRTGRPLGAVDFIERIEAVTGKELASKRPSPKPKKHTN